MMGPSEIRELENRVVELEARIAEFEQWLTVRDDYQAIKGRDGVATYGLTRYGKHARPHCGTCFEAGRLSPLREWKRDATRREFFCGTCDEYVTLDPD